MDRTILFEFIKTTEEEFLRKYAKLVTEILTKPQLLDLAKFFELKVTLIDEEEKATETAKKPQKKKAKKKYTEEEIEMMIQNSEKEENYEDLDNPKLSFD